MSSNIHLVRGRSYFFPLYGDGLRPAILYFFGDELSFTRNIFTKVAGIVTQHHLVRRYFSHNRPMIFTAMGIFMDVPVPISSRGFQHDFPIKKLNVLFFQKRQTKCVVSCSDMPKPAEKPGMSGDTERGGLAARPGWGSVGLLNL